MAAMSEVKRSVRMLCWDRDTGMCLRCPGGRMAAQLHHRRPRGMGSTSRPETNLPANLVSLCAECHAWIESHRDVATLQGWLVPQVYDPAEVAILTPRGVLRLDNAGGKVLERSQA